MSYGKSPEKMMDLCKNQGVLFNFSIKNREIKEYGSGLKFRKEEKDRRIAGNCDGKGEIGGKLLTTY